MIIIEENGKQYIGKTGADLCKAMGQTHFAKSIIMTDEDGAIVGMQGGTMDMAKSVTMIKALNEQASLMKSQTAKPVTAKKTEKPLRKSFYGSTPSGFEHLTEQLNELKQLQRRLFG